MSDIIITFILVVIAFSASVVITYLISNTNSWLNVIDTPVERSLHSKPTPSSGGFAIIASILIFGAISSYYYSITEEATVIAVCIIVVGGISFLDDRYDIHPLIRIIFHSTAAIVLITYGFRWSEFELPGILLYWPEGVVGIVSFLFIVWMINLYNFMDGMDGFAAGMAVVGFATFATFGYLWQEWYFMSLSLVVMASSLGFLVFNFPPARIFMGDVGSSVLGLLVAVFSLWGTKERMFPLWISVLIFSPFIIDATVTLVSRLIKREIIWEPHRKHYYQKLVTFGWSHKKTVLFEYALMVGCSISALIVNFRPATDKWIVLICWIVIYIAAMLVIDSRAREQEK